MVDEGFNVDVSLDVGTGLVFGGNDFNCGTWMDKNGSSEKVKNGPLTTRVPDDHLRSPSAMHCFEFPLGFLQAHNKGIPATPRDGAAVEIIGLLKSTLRFVSSLPPEIFPYCSVVTPDGGECTYSRWNALLKSRFPVCFYVPEESEEKEGGASFFIDKNLVNRRGIVKDTYKQTRRWGDYQLRPNACVALAVAPELFSKVRPNSSPLLRFSSDVESLQAQVLPVGPSPPFSDAGTKLSSSRKETPLRGRGPAGAEDVRSDGLELSP